jgi:hypothetical protein
VRNIEKDFEISELGAFATPGLHLAHVPLALIAECGLICAPDFLNAGLRYNVSFPAPSSLVRTLLIAKFSLVVKGFRRGNAVGHYSRIDGRQAASGNGEQEEKHAGSGRENELVIEQCEPVKK